MFRKTKRHFTEKDFLFATFNEFLKCWGSGGRSRLFMESKESGAFVNFSAFLGHPGMRRSFQQSKMASDEEIQAQDPKSNSDSKEKKSKKKSKKKTERDNQRAAIFQKRKKDEVKLVAAAATHSASSSVAVTSTPTPDFEFSEPLSENISGLDDSEFMNLDGNVTLNQGTTSSEGGKENKEERETASEDPHSKGDSKDDSKDEAKDDSKDEAKDDSKDESIFSKYWILLKPLLISKDEAKDDSKDDSRVEILCSAPSPEQEKDGKDTDNSDSTGLETSSPLTLTPALDSITSVEVPSPEVVTYQGTKDKEEKDAAKPVSKVVDESWDGPKIPSKIRGTSFQKARFRNRFKVRLKKKISRRLELMLSLQQSEQERADNWDQRTTLYDKHDQGLIDKEELYHLLHPIMKSLKRMEAHENRLFHLTAVHWYRAPLLKGVTMRHLHRRQQSDITSEAYVHLKITLREGCHNNLLSY